MKQIIHSIIILAIVIGQSSIANAQSTDHAIPYQAVARDASGNLIANHAISLRFSLITGSPTGPVYYQEVQTATTNAFGLFTVYIFEGVALTTTGVFDPSKWQVIATLRAYTKVEIDVTGGTSYVDMGTSQMLNVPFALYASGAGSIPGGLVNKGSWDAVNNIPHLTSGVGTNGDLYIVSNASPDSLLNTSLDGNSKYKAGDVVVYNQSIYMRLSTSTAPLFSEDISFSPGLGMSSTNVQSAIDEAWTTINSIGSVIYQGTWDVAANSPNLASGVGTKGFYYVVSVASTAATPPLDGINTWNVGDWAIYNGTAWGKVNNNDAAVAISFTPNTNITSTNVQDAIVQVRDGAANPFNIIQDSSHRFVTDAEKTTWNGKQDAVSGVNNNFTFVNSANMLVNGVISNQSDGVALDNGKTIRSSTSGKSQIDFGGSGDRISLTTDGGIGSESFLDMDATGITLGRTRGAYNLVAVRNLDALIAHSNKITLDAPIYNFNQLSPSTVPYIDASKNLISSTITTAELSYLSGATSAIQTQINSKVSKSGDTMTGNLILSADPSSALGAATKQYVDAADATMSTSFISRVDDGVTIYQTTAGARKRFGIGDNAPECPLGIKGDVPNDDQMIGLRSANGSQDWNINLNPTPSDIPGFSIDDATSGTSISRLFIQPTSGYIGIGTTQPASQLDITGNVTNGRVGMKISNLAALSDASWQAFNLSDPSHPLRDGAFGISEESSLTGASHERLTILSGGNTGINETLPFATLHVTRLASDPDCDIQLAENTGIILAGPIIGQNLALDAHQIQARTGAYVGASTTMAFSATALNIQPLGGDIIIHSSSSVATDKINISAAGKIGIGKDPIESVDINGAIAIGDASSSSPADGTIRWTGTDFEGRKGGAWVSLTSASGSASQRVSFLAKQNGTVAVPPGVEVTMPYNTESYDDANGAAANNFSAGIFTVPVSGNYHFDASATWQPFSTLAYIEIVVNGTVVGTTASYLNGSIFTSTISKDMKLNSGDQVTIKVAQGTSSSQAILGLTFYNTFSGHLFY